MRVDGEGFIAPPKTPKSIRDVPIPDFLYVEIQDYISRLYGIQPQDRLFYFTKGIYRQRNKSPLQKSGRSKNTNTRFKA